MKSSCMPNDLTLSQYLSRTQFLRERCRNRRVLHLGCSSGRYINDRLQRGSLLHGILAEEAEELYGLDLDARSLDLLQQLGFTHLYQGNAEKLEELDLRETFDVVLAGDLLEHITKPGAMLDGVKRFLKPTGRFIVSTNNAFGLHYQLRRWMGSYVEHIEHVCFFSPETLLNLFQRHKYRVLEIYGAYTEPPHSWQQKLRFAIGYPVFKLAPVLAGTLIVIATPQDDQSP